MKLRSLVSVGDPWERFAQYYSQVGRIMPQYATRLLVLLNEPKILAYNFQRKDDPELARHLANICDERSPYAKEMNKIFGAEQMAAWRATYQQLAEGGVNFERFLNPFYTFKKIQQSNGKESYIDRAYRDTHDFKINPKLLAALELDTCPAITNEGRALWTYAKLCSVMKYDEGYMYHPYRQNLNDYPTESFSLVEDVTPNTPTTCYNFTRIAVKLLNQIPGINATIIAAGKKMGHFRFGFYSNKLSVDAEAINAVGAYNDLARVKLGILPMGLRPIYGEDLLSKLLTEVVKPWLETQPNPMSQYLSALGKVPTKFTPTKIDLPILLKTLQEHKISGTDAVQVIFKMNTQF